MQRTTAIQSMSTPTDLVLVQATTQVLLDECRSQNANEWAAPIFTNAQYVAREQLLSTSAFSATRKTWMLVSKAAPTTVLCSCETYERPTTIIDQTGVTGTGLCISIASVFTLESNRGNGYARKMIMLMAERIPTITENVLCSNLFSDIGPDFYAGMGWIVHSSEQGEIEASAASVEALQSKTVLNAEYVNASHLEVMIAHDVETSLVEMKDLAVKQDRRVVSIHPTTKNIEWIHARAALYASHSSNPCPTRWGAFVGKQFILWTHDFKDNVLLITRARVKDASVLHHLISLAVGEAIAWKFSKVVTWNPSFSLDIMRISNREGSIPSMRMFGEYAGEKLIWFANEKFGWV